MPDQHRPRGPHHLGGEPPLQIRIEFQRKLGLRPIPFEDLLDGFQACERLLDRGAADAAGDRLRPQLFEPRVKWRNSRRQRRDRRQRGRLCSHVHGEQNCKKNDSKSSHHNTFIGRTARVPVRSGPLNHFR